MPAIKARTVAVIGAGPSGLAAAKYLRAEKAFSKIMVFEQRGSMGGIWNSTPSLRSEPLFAVPQTNPAGMIEEPIWYDTVSQSNKSKATSRIARGEGTPSFVSPVYDRLETNIPRSLMGFSDLNWPDETQLFPKHDNVLKYIQEYGKDVEDLVKLQTQITNVEPTDDNRAGGWKLTFRDLHTGVQRKELFDTVIVANGHFIVPYVPDIAGIREWNDKYPGVISHSKYFRNPESFANRKVIVVGNSASGLDISSQIAPLSQHPLLWSNKSPSRLEPAPSSLKREHPQIARFHLSNRGVEFADGTIESDIDAIIFATGYFYSLPFLQNVEPRLIEDGSHVRHTYQHLFFTPRPTLSFLTLPQRIIPFPLSEAQSAVVARVYSGRLVLPDVAEMRRWEEDTISSAGSGPNFHCLPSPKDGNYINEMSHWALSASTKDGLENDGKGKCPPIWGEWEFWCRQNFPEIRRKFSELSNEEKAKVRTLDELGGFSFEQFQRERRESEGKLI